MTGVMKAGIRFAVLAAVLSSQTPMRARDTMQQDNMKQDKMSGDKMMQDDKMMHSDKAKTLFTGNFHGKVHQTEGRATVYQEADGKLVLRLTHFKTSNGPDVHVILVATKDAADDANFAERPAARTNGDPGEFSHDDVFYRDNERISRLGSFEPDRAADWIS